MRRALAVFAALAALATAGAVSASGPDFAGRWRLVEQTYGRGEANLEPAGGPLILEFIPQGAGFAGNIHPETAGVAARPWPAWQASGRDLPLQLLDPPGLTKGGAIRAHYLVKPSDGDSLVLEVQETYRVEPGGDSLTGTVEVTFRLGDETRGSYTLHRRFERVR
ncbi:MAG TPA: hypothetical protein VNI57_09465 [Candidatus Saccharimonadales bacterium]|nr:hypothetical protein [Candidatus Saccharimonadales bacterium]